MGQMDNGNGSEKLTRLERSVASKDSMKPKRKAIFLAQWLGLSPKHRVSSVNSAKARDAC
jgi:hypothetical protein